MKNDRLKSAKKKLAKKMRSEKMDNSRDQIDDSRGHLLKQKARGEDSIASFSN